MNCEEYRAALLAGDEASATARHEESCSSCRAQSSSLQAAQGALTDPTVWEEPSPGLGLQIENLISAAALVPAEEAKGDRTRWILSIAAAVVTVAIATGLIAMAQNRAPDWEVALPATDLAPTAIASVRGWNEPSGTRMIVDIEGLTPAPDGFMYEFWLSEGPIHVSAGTFHSGGEIELWSGVPRGQFPRLWITLEPVDEDESPSGQTVLDTAVADV